MMDKVKIHIDTNINPNASMNLHPCMTAQELTELVLASSMLHFDVNSHERDH